MNKKTPRAIAEIVGKSPQYIDREIKKDPPTLTVIHDGNTASGKPRLKVDYDGQLTQDFIIKRLGHIPTDLPKKERKKYTPVKAKQEQPEKPKQPLHEPGFIKPPPISTNPSGVSSLPTEEQKNKTWYDIQLKKQQIEEKRIKNEQQRGNLIEKSLVELLFGKIHQIDVDQIKPLGIELNPKLISITNEMNKAKAKSICDLVKIDDSTTLKNIESILNSGEKEMKTKIISACEDISATILKNVQSETEVFLAVMESETK